MISAYCNWPEPVQLNLNFTASNSFFTPSLHHLASNIFFKPLEEQLLLLILHLRDKSALVSFKVNYIYSATNNNVSNISFAYQPFGILSYEHPIFVDRNTPPDREEPTNTQYRLATC